MLELFFGQLVLTQGLNSGTHIRANTSSMACSAGP